MRAPATCDPSGPQPAKFMAILVARSVAAGKILLETVPEVLYAFVCESINIHNANDRVSSCTRLSYVSD